jgi:hypothetical protein
VFIIPGNYTFVEGLGRQRQKQPSTPPTPQEHGAE